MKILIISYFAPPALNPESIVTAKCAYGLASTSKNNKVLLLTAKKEIVWGNTDITLIPLLGNKVKLYHTGLKVPLSEKIKNKVPSPLIKAIFALSFVVSATIKAIHIIKKEKPDIIYSRSTPIISHFIPFILKTLFTNKFVWFSYFSDPIVDGPFAPPKHTIKSKILTLLEKVILSKSDGVIFTTNQIKKMVLEKYKSKGLFEKLTKKTFVIPHCFVKSWYKNQNTNNNDINKKILYLGNFYGKRQPDTFLKALTMLAKEDKNLNATFFFYSRQHQQVDEKAKELKITHLVKCFMPVCYTKALHLMTNSDGLLLIDAPKEGKAFLSSKVIDYIGANKPIFALTEPDGESAKILKKDPKNFIVSPQEDITIIKNKLKDFIKHIETTDFNSSNKISVSVYKEYECSSVCKKLYKIFESYIHNKA